MTLIFKKINFYLLNNGINLKLLFLYIIFFLKSIRNYFICLTSNKIDSFYIPNLGIKNTIFINPEKVNYICSVPLKFNLSTQFILDFDWQENMKSIDNNLDHPTYVTCNELFVKNLKIKNCKNYLYFKKQIKKNGIFKNCKNETDILNFLRKKIDLFLNIKKFGVKKNYLFNIQFMIDQNFNLVKINSGNHRMAISKILKLEKIPVEIKIIHLSCFNNYENNKINLKTINKIISDIEKKYN